MVHLTEGVLCFTFVALVSWSAVRTIRAYAAGRGFLDVPNERSSHLTPMPTGGGIAIVVIGVMGGLTLAFVHHSISTRDALAFVVGGLLVATVSWIDDLGHVPYWIRLAVQGAGALTLALGYVYWHSLTLPVVGTIVLGGLGLFVTLVWMVGLINAFNFMDGVDGMVGGQALIAGLGWIVLGKLTGHPLFATCGAVLAASSLGFLLHNWQPATIFMGDVGSTFLGYCFAALPVVAAQYDSRLALAGVLLVWPSIFDSGFTILRRLRQGENIFAGHRTFLFHRLVAVGWSHAQAASLYFLLPILGALLAVTWDMGTPSLHLAIVMTITVACISLWLLVLDQERRVLVTGTPNLLTRGVQQLALQSHREHDRAAFAPGWGLLSFEGTAPLNGQAIATVQEHGRAQVNEWDGVERRRNLDRRSGIDRRSGPKRGPDRRASYVRRASERRVTWGVGACVL